MMIPSRFGIMSASESADRLGWSGSYIFLRSLPQCGNIDALFDAIKEAMSDDNRWLRFFKVVEQYNKPLGHPIYGLMLGFADQIALSREAESTKDRNEILSTIHTGTKNVGTSVIERIRSVMTQIHIDENVAVVWSVDREVPVSPDEWKTSEKLSCLSFVSKYVRRNRITSKAKKGVQIKGETIILSADHRIGDDQKRDRVTISGQKRESLNGRIHRVILAKIFIPGGLQAGQEYFVKLGKFAYSLPHFLSPNDAVRQSSASTKDFSLRFKLEQDLGNSFQTRQFIPSILESWVSDTNLLLSLNLDDGCDDLTFTNRDRLYGEFHDAVSDFASSSSSHVSKRPASASMDSNNITMGEVSASANPRTTSAVSSAFVPSTSSRDEMITELTTGVFFLKRSSKPKVQWGARIRGTGLFKKEWGLVQWGQFRGSATIKQVERYSPLGRISLKLQDWDPGRLYRMWYRKTLRISLCCRSDSTINASSSSSSTAVISKDPHVDKTYSSFIVNKTYKPLAGDFLIYCIAPLDVGSKAEEFPATVSTREQHEILEWFDDNNNGRSIDQEFDSIKIGELPSDKNVILGPSSLLDDDSSNLALGISSQLGLNVGGCISRRDQFFPCCMVERFVPGPFSLLESSMLLCVTKIPSKIDEFTGEITEWSSIENLEEMRQKLQEPTRLFQGRFREDAKKRKIAV